MLHCTLKDHPLLLVVTKIKKHDSYFQVGHKFKPIDMHLFVKGYKEQIDINMCYLYILVCCKMHEHL